jgi:phage anti-repressor protein
VSNDFIDDLFSVVDPFAGKKVFAVNADVAAKWQGMSKCNLMRAVRHHGFKEGTDYTVKNEPQPPGKRLPRRPRLTVLLTTECFKCLCMMVNTPKSKQARAYFIAVEDTLLHYREDIEASLRGRIEVLERNQAPKAALQGSSPGVVYVLEVPTSEGLTAHKLGMTNNFVRRMQSHQSAMADNVNVEYVLKTDHMKDVEACAKALLRGTTYRKYKEVYKADLDVIKKVLAGCDEISREIVSLPQKKRQKTFGGCAHGLQSDYFLVLHKPTKGTAAGKRSPK